MKDTLIRLSIVLLLLLSLCLISCFKWDNPYDADNISAQLISPQNLRADAITETLYKLSWTDACEVEDGFKIDRKDGNGAWQIDYATVGKNVVEYSIDLSGITPEDIYIKWRIRAYNQDYVGGYSNEALLEPNTVANPVFIPAGATYNNDQTVTISTATLGATIRYTTDNSEPGISSPVFSDPILINTNKTLKAKAFKAGWKSSNVVTVTYSMVVSTPVFSLAAGTYTSDQNLSITCATNEAKIRYTKDGSEPSESSALYSGQIIVNSNTTVKAKAFKTGWNASTIVSAAYSFQVATPSFTPTAGTYETAQNVAISCATNGAAIRYTIDGSEPTASSALYDSPIIVTEGNITIKAKAFKTNWVSSALAIGAYSIELPGFVYVQGGTFNNDTSDVTVSSYYMDKYELTQAEYQAVMGTNPASGYGVGSNYPVYFVSWFNAIEYSNRRSLQEGITPCYSYSSYGTNPDSWPSGWNTSNTNHTNVSCNWTANGYRLPTEAEWQFAARGGNQTHGYTYSGSNTIVSVAWYYDNSFNMGSGHPDYGTHTVGSKTANEFGLYDMSGNVGEWNWDIYGNYPSGSQTNPHGATSGSGRVVRGGSWSSDAYYCTVSFRVSIDATNSGGSLGFRLCRFSP